MGINKQVLEIEKQIMKEDKSVKFFEIKEYRKLVEIGLSIDMGLQKPDRNYHSSSSNSYTVGLE